jgi:hypothetical protein
MKHTITILLSILITTAHAQVSVSMRTGYSFKTVDAFVAPALNYTFNNITLGGEMMVNVKDDAPVNVGLKGSYQFGILEAGAAAYYQVYSMDDYDKSRNGFAPGVFIAAHYKVFFVQYDYLKESKLSIGLKANL